MFLLILFWYDIAPVFNIPQYYVISYDLNFIKESYIFIYSKFLVFVILCNPNASVV